LTARRELNQYLFYEFGGQDEEDAALISDDWPYKLAFLGRINSGDGELEVYEFSSDGEPYFALYGQVLDCFPTQSMTVEDLQRQKTGAAWIADGEPIDLDTSIIGDPSVPPVPHRRAAILELAQLGGIISTEPRILEGLYLRRRGTYLALVEASEGGDALIVGDGIRSERVGSPEVSPWRRLAVAVGSLLERGLLPNHR
jgi:hypothetical protein